MTAPRVVVAWGTALGSSLDTHHRIAKDVVDNDIDATTYPDLVRFRDKLEDGSNTESHDLPDDNTTQWWGNGVGPAPETWFYADVKPDGQEGTLSLYKKYSFEYAYKEMGFELHCAQDEFVPAHIRRCCHGTPGVYLLDDMEYWAYLFTFGYASSSSPWTYSFTYSGGTSVFEYWLNDSMDDDDRDDIGSDADDEVDASGVLMVDGPSAWGVPNTDWGTYGQPPYYLDEYGIPVLLEMLPGQNEGWDYYGDIADNSIMIREQLKKSYDGTLTRIKAHSAELPPLVPDDDTHGKPSISAKIFGPNKPVDVSLVAMENRQKTVLVSMLAGAAPMKDTTGKVWDGGEAATYDLAADGNASSLPWKDMITRSWNGDLGTGQLADGNHSVKMKVKDQDGNDSEERTRSVKYDETKPTGTITVSVLP